MFFLEKSWKEKCRLGGIVVLENITIHSITKLSELNKYEEHWSRLLNMKKNNNPFIEYPWIYLWWEHFGESQNVEIIVVKEHDEVIAFFPFCYKKYGPIYIYHLIAFGQSNYMDFIYTVPNLEPLLESVINHLVRSKKHIVFYLHGLLKSSTSNGAISSYLTANQKRFSNYQVITPYINLHKIQMDEYIKKRQKLHRLDRREKRIRENGTVETLTIGPEKMETIFRIHDKRWKKKSDTSGFTSPAGKKFYSSLARVRHQDFQTQLDGLFIDNKLIAFNYGFKCRDRYTSYVLGFDDNYDVFSPGRILEKEKILQCSQQQTPIFDLSIGYEAYKFEWHTDLDYTERYLFSSDSHLSKTVLLLFTIKSSIIDKIKKYPSIVLFKRNKLGKLLYVMKNFFHQQEKKEVRKILKDYLQQKQRKLYLDKSYIVYEIPRKDVPDMDHGDIYTELTLKLTNQSSPLFDNYIKEICTKIYGAYQGYFVNESSHMEEVFWINEKVIRIDDISYIRDFRKSSVMIENWKSDNLLAICAFVKKLSKSNKIIIYIESTAQKERSLAESLGFVKSYQVRKRNLFGSTKEEITVF